MPCDLFTCERVIYVLHHCIPSAFRRICLIYLYHSPTCTCHVPALHWAAYKGHEEMCGLLLHLSPRDLEEADVFGQVISQSMSFYPTTRNTHHPVATVHALLTQSTVHRLVRRVSNKTPGCCAEIQILFPFITLTMTTDTAPSSRSAWQP